MADFLENVDVGHYRSLDMPKNFAIKVTIRKVNSSFLPSFQIGSQQSIHAQEGVEIAGEAVEMPEIGQNRRNGSDKKDEEEEVFIFHWQQKAFSEVFLDGCHGYIHFGGEGFIRDKIIYAVQEYKREMELYENTSDLYSGGLERHYAEEVRRLRERRGRPNKRLFSYVDHDTFANLDEETRTLTTSPAEKPSFLVEKMMSVRRRNVGSGKLNRRNRPGGFSHHINPLTTYTSELTKNAAHVLSTHYRTMYIMADLAPDIKSSSLADEYVVCSIKIDINGQIFIKPDFNNGELPYRIETQYESRDVYEYTLEHCSQLMSHEQKEQEIKSFNELYNRHALFLASQVGTDFDYVPETGVLKMDVFGEIVSAKGFEYDGLYIHFFMELPPNWMPGGDPYLSGVTQTCYTKQNGPDDVAHFCFPFDFSLIYHEQENSDDFIHWPFFFVEVLSLDSWERHRTEGYGYVIVPSQPGSHEITINTWRPLGNGTVPELKRFFIGGSPELEDPTYPQQPVANEEKVLSKFYFRTATSGSVTVRLNVVQQCQEFMESKKAKKRTRSILDRLGGLSALDSLGQVMDAFQRARKRMVAAREGLPLVK